MLHYFIVFFISMVPLIELRGAIPYAVGFGLNMYASYAIAIIGNMLPVPVIFFFARRAAKSLKQRPEGGFTLLFSFLSGSRFREQAHGQARLPQAFSTWILRKAASPPCAASSLPE